MSAHFIIVQCILMYVHVEKLCHSVRRKFFNSCGKCRPLSQRPFWFMLVLLSLVQIYRCLILNMSRVFPFFSIQPGQFHVLFTKQIQSSFCSGVYLMLSCFVNWRFVIFTSAGTLVTPPPFYRTALSHFPSKRKNYGEYAITPVV